MRAGRPRSTAIWTAGVPPALLFLFVRLEGERNAVHAIALAGRLRAVVKEMTEMAAAFLAVDLGAGHEKTGVGVGFDRAVHRRVKARPARPAIEFCRGLEQRLATPGAMIDAGIVFLVEGARAGALGAVLAQDVIRFRAQLLAPLGVAVL